MSASTPNHWKLGLFVTVGLASALGILIWFGANQLHREAFLRVTYFDEPVQGLEVGAPVRFRGVGIGHVQEITIAPDFRLVEVWSEIHLDDLVRLGLPLEAANRNEAPPDLRAQLAVTGITGVKYLLVDRVDPQVHPPMELGFAPPEGYLPSMPSTLKSLEDSVVQTMSRAPVLFDQTTELVRELRTTVEVLELPRLRERLDQLMTLAEQKIEATDPAAVTRTLEELQSVLGEVRTWVEEARSEGHPIMSMVSQIDSTALSMERAIREARIGDTSASFRDTARSMQELAIDARGLSREMKEDLAVLRETLEAVRALAELLERDPAALLHGRDTADAKRGGE